LGLSVVCYEDYSEREIWIKNICKICCGEFRALKCELVEVWTEYWTENLCSVMFYVRLHTWCHQPSVSVWRSDPCRWRQQLDERSVAGARFLCRSRPCFGN
jgi:hypothetical protein